MIFFWFRDVTWILIRNFIVSLQPLMIAPELASTDLATMQAENPGMADA